MDGNFLSIYNNKLLEYENLIKTDLENSEKYKSEMADYMLKCVPFIQKYIRDDNEEIEKHTLDNLFNSKTMKKVGLQKKQILNEYLFVVENKVVPTPKVSGKKHKTEQQLKCSKCDSSNVYIDELQSDLICIECGKCEFYQLEGGLTYKEEQEVERVFNYFYKRENHFNEWLNQFQARETTNIPDDVINKLKADFKKNKIKDLKEITQAKVKSCLKKLGHSKYYEHVPYITNLLNGIKPPTMKQELEDRLRHMFHQIQDPFDKHCPEERKNFLSYSYVLYKFCELLSEDEYLPCFPLLKSKEKLYQQDVIWKKICKELQWEFIATN
jgi:hypothetical protein